MQTVPLQDIYHTSLSTDEYRNEKPGGKEPITLSDPGQAPAPSPAPPGLHPSPSRLFRGCTCPDPASPGLHPPLPFLLRRYTCPDPGSRQPRRGGRATRAQPRTRASAGGWSRLAWEPPRKGRTQYPPARLAASACCPRTSRVWASSRASGLRQRGCGLHGDRGPRRAVRGDRRADRPACARSPAVRAIPPGAVPPRVRKTPPENNDTCQHQ